MVDDGRFAGAPTAETSSLAEYLQRCERYFILETLERQGWQIGTSARLLEISRKSLWETHAAARHHGARFAGASDALIALQPPAAPACRALPLRA